MTAIDLLGLDYYHRAAPSEHWSILRRTTELAMRCEGRDRPAYGAEVGAGFPPFFAPLDELDSMYALTCAMAYGLRGFNLYMAVERDRWIGAPDRSARQAAALRGASTGGCSRRSTRTKLHTLTRRAPVRLVVPRALRRLARAMHAFGPLTPALFNVIGVGWRESVLERDFGLGEPPVIAAEAYLRAFERALHARGVPFAYAGGETVEHSTVGAQWVVCTTGAASSPSVVDSLHAVREAGAVVTMGPARADARWLDAPAATADGRDRLRDRAARRHRPGGRAGRPPHRRAGPADVAGGPARRARHGARGRAGRAARGLRDEPHSRARSSRGFRSRA